SEHPDDLIKYHIRGRYQLIVALNEAAALEQMLMAQYLYAAASMRSLPTDYNPPSHEKAELATCWRDKL
ncbi:unnamed protein product, partial [Chrysoparadoxa australica]